jgi:hypothetical protein
MTGQTQYQSGLPVNDDVSLWVRIGADVNGDGRFTVSDIGSWGLEILVLPGNVFLYLVINHLPRVAEFFELGTEDFGGVVAIWAAVLIWLAAIIVAGSLLSAIRDLDRRLTSWALGRWEELKRLLRVLRRRVAGLIARRRASSEDLVVETVDLAGIETAVLRCLSRIDDGDVLTLDEIAASLRRPARDLKPVLRRLIDLGFVQSGSDSFSKKNGHRIGPAGQMYLLGT